MYQTVIANEKSWNFQDQNQELGLDD